MMILGITTSSSATQVSGDIWGTWDSTMNPIEVVGELRVPPDSSLTIGPGCYIEFQDYYALTLDTSAAFIRAIGTEEDSIVFTPAPGRVWNGIHIFSTDIICQFAYCVMEKAYVNDEISELGSGGAIYCEQSDLDIKNCSITNNRAISGHGGGIYMLDGDVSISNCIISNNFCAFGGSGICLKSYLDSDNAVITENIFKNDTTSYLLGGELSGSVECRGYSNLIFKRNIIKENYSEGVGAIRLGSFTATIDHNFVLANYGWGGRNGLWIDIEDSGTVAFNEIAYNGGIYSGGFYGSGLALLGSNINVYNNLIVFNETGSHAGGVYLVGAYNSFINNIIAYNSAYTGGGIYIDNTSIQIPNILKNNIIWGNVADFDPQIYNDGNRPLEVSYCDVEGGWTGVGNIDVDPLFRDTANGDFHLMSTFCGDLYDSPCIDVGDPIIQDYLLDCSWGLGLQISDMGAYGGGDSLLQAVGENLVQTPERFILLRNYPNPFNAGTNIEYVLFEQSYVTITIYDILGREVEILHEGMKQQGAHTINWNADNHPSGVYFARLKSPDITKNLKMILLK
jgi:hypothetical protein